MITGNMVQIFSKKDTLSYDNIEKLLPQFHSLSKKYQEHILSRLNEEIEFYSYKEQQEKKKTSSL